VQRGKATAAHLGLALAGVWRVAVVEVGDPRLLVRLAAQALRAVAAPVDRRPPLRAALAEAVADLPRRERGGEPEEADLGRGRRAVQGAIRERHTVGAYVFYMACGMMRFISMDPGQRPPAPTRTEPGVEQPITVAMRTRMKVVPTQRQHAPMAAVVTCAVQPMVGLLLLLVSV
jgi:hypothetical protein